MPIHIPRSLTHTHRYLKGGEPYEPDPCIGSNASGRLRDVQISHLLDGTSRSCGCARRIKTVEEYLEKKFRVKPKSQVKAPSTEKLYKMWLNLKQGRGGAPLCAEWQTYHNFKTWALKTGYTEGKHTHWYEWTLIEATSLTTANGNDIPAK